MASALGNEDPALIARLLAHPRRFSFFQAVRILEAQAAREEEGPARLGDDATPAREVARVRANPSLAFAGAELGAVQQGTKGGDVELRTNFMGFVGVAGVLPQHYTALVIERVHLRDSALRDLLDVFHHRALSHFYRAWLKYRFAFDTERELRSSGAHGAFSRAVLSLVGLGLPELQGRLALDDSGLALESGHFARRVRTADGLARALRDLFGVPVRVHEFAGRWLTLPPEERCVFPRTHEFGDVRVSLGRGATLGDSVWDVQSGVRLELGPLRLARFLDLAPGGRSHERLRATVSTYLGIEFDATFDLALAAGESPGTRLAATSEAGASQLGRSAWLEHRGTVPGPRAGRFASGQLGGDG